MGLIYYVACRDCKVVRDLDKFSPLGSSVSSREEALALRPRLRDYSFNVALLTSFLWQHSGHNCTVFNENSECYEVLDPYYGLTKEDVDYW